MNTNHFQFSTIACNLTCWLALFELQESHTLPELTHRTMATKHLRIQYRARMMHHGGQTKIYFGVQYPQRDRFDQLMA